jgi:hypothetical protein
MSPHMWCNSVLLFLNMAIFIKYYHEELTPFITIGSLIMAIICGLMLAAIAYFGIKGELK